MAIGLVGCKKNDPKPQDPEQQFLNSLSGTWVVGGSGVQVDGVDITNQYTDFSISFNDDKSFKVFEVVNGGSAFLQETDSYEFMREDFSILKRRSDNTLITIERPDDNTLILSLTLLPAANGRSAGTFGEFRFNLKR